MSRNQKEAAEFINGIAMVVAMPGSGKTKVLTQRIANLVQSGVAPENIMGVTFTKNAATTLKIRLKTMIGQKANRLTVSTIHSFCYRIAFVGMSRASSLLHLSHSRKYNSQEAKPSVFLSEIGSSRDAN